MRWASSTTTRSHSRRCQAFNEVVVAREVVESRNQQVALTEGVAGAGGLDQLSGQDREVEPELVVQLVLPLADETTRSDDEALGEGRPAASAP